MIQRVLENGLTVIVKPDRKAPVAVSNVWFAVGSNHEWPGVFGWAHGIEHMLFKGTPRRRPGDVSREVKQAGGELNAGTGHESTNYYIVVPSRNLDVAVSIHADVVQHASFDPEELARERHVLVEENKMRRDRHAGGGHTYDALLELAFREAPYRRSIGGPDESLLTAKREDILTFRDTWYVPSNCAVVVVGDVDPEATFERIEAAYGGWQGKPRPERPALTEPRQDAFRLRGSSGDVEKVYLKMGWHAPGELDHDSFALKVLQQILGRGRSSRLFQSVREKQGLVSDIAMFEETGRDLGFLVVDAVTDALHVENAQAAILEEIERIKESPLPPDEVEKARTAIERDYASGNEPVEGQAAHLGYFWTIGEIGVADDYVARIRRVRDRDVEDVARRYLGLEQCSMNLLFPRSAEGRIATDPSAVYARLRDRLARPRRHAAKGAAAPGGNGDLGAVSREVLPNGLTVITRRLDRAPLVALGAFVRSGTVHETAATNGLTALAQRVMIKGTRTRDAEAIASAIESLGGSIAPSYSADAAGCFMTVLRRNLPAAWGLLAEILTRPSFPADEIERERRLLLDEIRALADNSMRNTMLEFARTVYGSHPYGLSPIGTIDSVSALDRDAVAGWYRRAWAPANMVISVVGDIDHAGVRDMLHALGSLPRGDAATTAPPPVESVRGRREMVLSKQVNQEVIFAGFPGPAATAPDRYPMEMLQALLSGMGNRMFTELRDRKSLCYFTGFMYRPYRSAGLLAAYIGTSPEKEAVATEGLLDELRKITEEPATAEELERAKHAIIGNFALDQQTAASLASLYAGCELLGLGVNWPSEYPERIMAVTADDVLAVARRYIDLENYAIVMTRPPSSAVEVAPR